MDIKRGYINADIEKKVFMQQPEGFKKLDKQWSPSVFKLRKSLYGMKPSGRNWYLTIKSFFQPIRFHSGYSRYVSLSEEKWKWYREESVSFGRFYGDIRDAGRLLWILKE